jgi:hypothetical protein
VSSATTEQVHDAMAGSPPLPTGFAPEACGRHETPPRR